MHIKKTTFRLIALSAVILSAALLVSATKRNKVKPTSNNSSEKRIQVAVLLDVSNSMDGLIEQTKSQLWTMVNTLGKATCDNKVPKIEIALYEYGRTNNDAKKGFVKQINSFITDLDSLSENLFNLKTNGGDEYCGEVIYASIDELPWSNSADDYKVVFIAGNEDFLQGKRHFTAGCNLAKTKNIIVNTIYCGPADEGVRLHWKLGGECGNGSYKNINADIKDVYIPSPHDSMIYVLNTRLNGTYVSYGYAGDERLRKQETQDVLVVGYSKKASLDRAAAKANAAVYGNREWDLVDADADGKFDYSKLPKNTLPDTLRNLNNEQLKKYVQQKSEERKSIQNSITELSKKRAEYITEYNKRNAAANNVPTLESEMNAMLKEQAKRYNIIVQ